MNCHNLFIKKSKNLKYCSWCKDLKKLANLRNNYLKKMDYKKFKEIKDKYGDCGSYIFWAEVKVKILKAMLAIFQYLIQLAETQACYRI